MVPSIGSTAMSHGGAAVADLLAVEEHRRFVLLALADDDDAVHRDGVEDEAHRVDRGAVGGVLVAPAHPAAGRRARRPRWRGRGPWRGCDRGAGGLDPSGDSTCGASVRFRPGGRVRRGTRRRSAAHREGAGRCRTTERADGSVGRPDRGGDGGGLGHRAGHRRAVRGGGRDGRGLGPHGRRRRARRARRGRRSRPRSTAVVAEHGRLDARGHTRPGSRVAAPRTWSPATTGDRVIDVNLTGTFLVAQARGRARCSLSSRSTASAASIVTIASVEGLDGTAGGSSYNASKGARRDPHQEPRDRLRPRRDPGQRDLPRLHRHADARRRVRRWTAWSDVLADITAEHQLRPARPARGDRVGRALPLLAGRVVRDRRSARRSTAATRRGTATGSARSWGSA